MRRNTYNCYYPGFTMGNERDLLPFFQAEVLPGETISLNTKGAVQLATSKSNYMETFRFRYDFYYVPHRMSWEPWMDYLTGENRAAAPAGVTTNWEEGAFFEDAAGLTVSPFLRSSYQQIYNEYYRSPETPEATLAWEAMALQKVDRKGLIDYDFRSARGNDNTFTIDTSGATYDLDLAQLRGKLQSAARGRAEVYSGDKYIDTLARYGVDLSWAVADRPEHLCGGTWKMSPGQVRSSGATTELGEKLISPSGAIKAHCSRKKFAEHGMVIGVCTFIPTTFNVNKRVPFGGQYPHGVEDLFTPENAERPERQMNEIDVIGTGGGVLTYYPWQHYQQGEQLLGRGHGGAIDTMWAFGDTPTSTQDHLNGVYKHWESGYRKAPTEGGRSYDYAIRSDTNMRRFNSVPRPARAVQR